MNLVISMLTESSSSYASPKGSVVKTRITPGALRMYFSRQRRREGLRCITFEMRDTEIDRLIQLGHLAAVDRDDRVKIAQALWAFLDRSALGRARPQT